MSIDFTTEIGAIRSKIGDTDESNLMLSDSEISIYLSGGQMAQTSLHLAAAECAISLAFRFGKLANSISEGGASVNWGNRAKEMRDLAAELRATDAANELETAEGLFDWAEQNLTEFSSNELWRNAILRESV